MGQEFNYIIGLFCELSWKFWCLPARSAHPMPLLALKLRPPFWCMLLLVRNAVNLQRVFTRILLQFFEATINSFSFLRDWRSRDAFLFFSLSFYDCPLTIKFQDGSEALWTNWKFFMTPLSRNSHKRLELKENQTKYRNMTRKPRSHIRILIYRAWANANSRTVSYKRLNNRLLSITFQQLALVV